jgi:hypothetical protein
MARKPSTPYISSVQNKLLIFSALLLLAGKLQGQSILSGGFVSVSVSDSLGSHNAGGMPVFQQERSNCLLVNGGMIFGQTGLFERQGLFQDDCREFTETRNMDIRVFPNPSLGLYRVQGMDILSCAVSDQSGRSVMLPQTLNPEQFEHSIDLRPFSEGLYYIHLTLSNGEIYTQNLIKINP